MVRCERGGLYHTRIIILSFMDRRRSRFWLPAAVGRSPQSPVYAGSSLRLFGRLDGLFCHTYLLHMRVVGLAVSCSDELG